MENKTGFVAWDDSLTDELAVRELALRDMYNDLLSASVEIGSICDMAHWASAGVAGRVHATGKQVKDITIGELMGMLQDQNDMHARIESDHNKGIGL